MNPPNVPLESHYIPAVNKGMTSGNKVMLTLHGRGDSLHSYKTLTQEINVTGLSYLLLNAPFTEMFGYTWYDDSYDFQDQRYVASLEKLEATFKAIKEQGFQSQDIFLFGFSQGGRMVIDLFHRLNEELAGVVALSPRVSKFDHLELSTNAKKTPFFVAHGEHDPIIPLKEVEDHLRIWSQTMDSVFYRSYPMEHEIDIMEIVQLRSWLNERL
ncbi:MAG: dienelactone hydrolase family protein [Halobacteriovoraceae bacterium]|nr:dienelactone hydrolase family protein [Halobacteriovoraceae bacterium]